MTHSVAELLTRAAATQPDDAALVEAASGRSLTWAAMDAEVDRVAAGLGEAGLVAGYRVALVLGNRIEFVTTYLGALRAQLVAVPLNPQSTVHELRRMLADCGARLVVADERSLPAVQDAIADLDAPPRLVTVGEPTAGATTYADLVAHPVRALPPSEDVEALAVLLYTSGASGPPRAVMLTHRALLANIEQIASVEPPMLAVDDVVLGVLPLFHVYGLNAILGTTIRQRARLVLADHFDPNGTLDLIDDQAITVVPVAPPVFPHWLRAEDLRLQLGAVRLVLSGSAPLARARIDAFEELAGVPVHQGYGLTEAAPVVTSTLCSTSAQAGSVGAALPGIEIRLVDEDGRAPEGSDPGEIEIRGANLFSGYWPEGSDGPDAEGWWATGDVGFLDPDGDLFLVDRVKDVVIVSGFNVYPVEVEIVLAGTPGVREVAVVGVPDDETGEAVVAHVVADGDPDEVQLAVRARAEEYLARFKQPTHVHVVDALPHTGTGKVQKGRLRAEARRQALDLVEAVSTHGTWPPEDEEER